mmetsp:Transcript_11259/g.30302  ORF Transcript_11259/g.30302 Transcript_11259/m.30302 type:complete len:243 (-) Transcript_11259:1206-1934(-)
MLSTRDSMPLIFSLIFLLRTRLSAALESRDDSAAAFNSSCTPWILDNSALVSSCNSLFGWGLSRDLRLNRESRKFFVDQRSVWLPRRFKIVGFGLCSPLNENATISLKPDRSESYERSSSVSRSSMAARQRVCSLPSGTMAAGVIAHSVTDAADGDNFRSSTTIVTGGPDFASVSSQSSTGSALISALVACASAFTRATMRGGDVYTSEHTELTREARSATMGSMCARNLDSCVVERVITRT